MTKPARSDTQRAHLKDLAERLDTASGLGTGTALWSERMNALVTELREGAREISAERAAAGLKLEVSETLPLAESDWADLAHEGRVVLALEVARANGKHRYELQLQPAKSGRWSPWTEALVLALDLAALQPPPHAVPVMAVVTEQGWDVLRANVDAILALRGRVALAALQPGEPLPGTDRAALSSSELALAVWELVVADAVSRRGR